MCAAGLIAMLALFGWANIAHYTAHMDPDIASEAVLAREIGTHGLRTPEFWVASTENKYFCPANLAGAIYPLTKNMNLSMGVSCTLFSLLMIALMLLTYYRAGYKEIPVICATILPFVLSVNTNGVLELFALYAGYYSCVIIATFIMLIVYSNYLRRERLSVKEILPSIIISVALGIQGLMGVLLLFIPVFVTECLRILINMFLNKSRSDGEYASRINCVKAGIRGGTGCLFFLTIAGISFFIAKLVSSGMTTTTRNIRHAPEKFVQEVMPAILGMFQPTVHPVYCLCMWIVVIIGFFFPFVMIVKHTIAIMRGNLHPDDLSSAKCNRMVWAVLPLHFSFLVMVAAMTFTTTDVAPRYGIYLLFAVGAGFGLFLQRLEYKGLYRIQTLLVFPVMMCTVFSLTYNYRNLITEDHASQGAYARIAEVMRDRGITRGYATFDWANTITVVSNDAVQVCPINNMTDLEGAKWLSNAAWYPPYTDNAEPVFYITTTFSEEVFRDSIVARGIRVSEEIVIDDFTMFLADHDYTVWKSP